MYKKILLIELAGIGDAVLSTPAIRNLKINFPYASIYYLTSPGPAKLIKKSNYVDRVFVFYNGLRGIFNNFRILNTLRKLNIDVAINLYQHFSLKGARKIELLLRFIKPGKTIGRNTDGKGLFYDIRIEDTMDARRHDVEYKLDLIQTIGCDIKDRKLEAWFDGYDVNQVKEFLDKNSIGDSDLLIGINPGGHRITRRWNWENFAKVGRILIEKYKAKLIITGSRDEKELAEKILHKISAPAIDTTGSPLTQLVALIKRCNLYVSNDTGPMHIANALGTPLVAIMGSGSMKTAPYQKDNCIIIKKDVECSPCYKFKCKDMRCLKLITVDEVLEACERMLENAKN